MTPMNKTVRTTWDVHAHAVPVNVLHAAKAGRLGMTLEKPQGNQSLNKMSAPTLKLPSAALRLYSMANPQRLADDLSSNRLADRVVLSVPPALLRYDVSGYEAVRWAELVNDGILETCRALPATLALAYLPLQEPALAVKEVMHRQGHPWTGFVIGTTVQGRQLDDEHFWPVFEILDAAQAFVFIHPTDVPDKRLNRFYLGNLFGNPAETTLAAAALVFSEVLDRFPSIRFCLAHGGGATAQLLGRWERGMVTNRPGIAQRTRSVRELVRCLYVDGITHDAGALQLCIDAFGIDKVLPGTDYPFPMGEDFEHLSVGQLPSFARDRILLENVPAALGVRGEKQG